MRQTRPETRRIDRFLMIARTCGSVTAKLYLARHAGSGSSRLGRKLILISFHFTLLSFHFYLNFN